MILPGLFNLGTRAQNICRKCKNTDIKLSCRKIHKGFKRNRVIRKGVGNPNVDHSYFFLMAETGFLKLVFHSVKTGTGYRKINPFQKKPESDNYPDKQYETEMT